MLHPRGQIGLGGVNQRMDMVWHPAESENDPSASLDFVAKSVSKTLVVASVVKLGTPATTPRHNVSTSELNSMRTRHGLGER